MTNCCKDLTWLIDSWVFLQGSAKGRSPSWLILMPCSIRSGYQRASETSCASYGGLMEIWRRILRSTRWTFICLVPSPRRVVQTSHFEGQPMTPRRSLVQKPLTCWGRISMLTTVFVQKKLRSLRYKEFVMFAMPVLLEVSIWPSSLATVDSY